MTVTPRRVAAAAVAATLALPAGGAFAAQQTKCFGIPSMTMSFPPHSPPTPGQQLCVPWPG